MRQVKIGIMFCVVTLVLFVACSDKDKIAWEKAKTLNTVESYEEYISVNPKGKYLNESLAQEKLLCGEFRGNIIGGKTGKPIPNAFVLLAKIVKGASTQPQFNKSLITTANSDGRFNMSKVPSGEYILVYALPEDVKGSSDAWSNININSSGPVSRFLQNDKGIRIEPLDGIFGGKEGIKTREEDKMDIKDGSYNGQTGKFVYPAKGVFTSVQYGLSLEYDNGKPLTVSIEKDKPTETTLKVAGK